MSDTVENCWNEIILDPSGNTYVGALAQKFATGRLALPNIFRLDDADFHVFEVKEDGAVVHRASQSSRRLAQGYMTPDRVCVYQRDAEKYRALAKELEKLNPAQLAHVMAFCASQIKHST